MMFVNRIPASFIILSFFVLSACGGGGGGTTSSGPTTQQGVFLDSAVAGLSYSSGSQSGVTGADGSFLYEQGATVTFKVGDIVIGTAPAQAIMTPISLVPGATDETDPTVANIVQFLMSIDGDGDPTNGIQISTAVTTAAAGQSLDFSLSDFDSNTSVLNAIALLTSGASTLATESDAQAHLNDTLMSNLAGIYNGTFSGDGAGTWTVVVSSSGVVTGSGCDTTTQTNFSISGTVSSSGDSALGFASDGSFAGNINLTGGFSGTWLANSDIDSGTFSGSKSNSASGGACSGGSSQPPPTGGVSGSVTITGTDTSVIGASFTPTESGGSFENTLFTVAILSDATSASPPIGSDYRFLAMQFSPSGSPLSVNYVKGAYGSQSGYSYIAECSDGADCSGVSFDRSTLTVTFSNVVLTPDLTEPDNIATGGIMLNGSVTFTLP